MPRLARKYLESSFLHIIVQGLNRSYIFKNDNLKSSYKSIFKKYLSQSNVRLIAYCIMDNHAHLLLYSNNINELSQLMKRTNTSYAMFYNKLNNRVGYVFRDRYYSQCIFDEYQLHNCISYIHFNPLKAGITKQLSDYKYSSYNEYINRKEFITSDDIKLVFGTDKNYLETFKKIHNIQNINNIKDVVEDYQNHNVIINKYVIETSKTLDEIKLNYELLGELLIRLRHYGRAFVKRYAEYFKHKQR